MQLCIEYSRTFRNSDHTWVYLWAVPSAAFSPSYMIAYIRIIRFDAIFYPLSHSTHFSLSSSVLLWLVRVSTRTSCKHVSDGINHTYAKIKGTGMALTNGRYYLHSTILLSTLLCGNDEDDDVWCAVCGVLVLFVHSRFENKMHAILSLFHLKIWFRLLLFSLAA